MHNGVTVGTELMSELGDMASTCTAGLRAQPPAGPKGRARGQGGELPTNLFIHWTFLKCCKIVRIH